SGPRRSAEARSGLAALAALAVAAGRPEGRDRRADLERIAREAQKLASGRMSRRSIPLALAVVCAATGCASRSSAPDKAGGDAAPVVLTLANTGSSLDQAPGVRDFVRRVEALSGGALRIRVLAPWGAF